MPGFNRSAGLFFCLILCFVLPTGAGAQADADKQAIVFASFGTTVPGALPAILHIRDRIQREYPATPVKIAFTSNIIRKIWRQRRDDPQFKKAYPGLPADIFTVQSPLATIANLQDEGYRTIIVQPGHLSPGEEYQDLVSCIDGLNSIETVKARYRPFEKLAISRPAMGTAGEKHPYTADLLLIARALAGDVRLAEKNGAALVYMAHGNTSMPSGSIYLEFAAIMNQLYPQVKTFIALVEGYPSLDQTLPQIAVAGVKKLLLKPFMTVAGDHTVNDLAGDDPDSWRSILSGNGYEVITVARGLGEIDGFADVYVHHLKETARDHGIVLQ
jgi:sirohydrochlorin cobaltochelatase